MQGRGHEFESRTVHMDAKVDIQIAVKSKYRYVNERYQPTDTHNDSFHWATMLDAAAILIPTISSAIYAQVVQNRARGGEIEVHYSIRIDNATHPEVGAGVIPLAKAQRAFSHTDLELTSVDTIQEALDNALQELRDVAKY